MSVIKAEEYKTIRTRDVIGKLQEHMENMPDALWGNAFPLKHSFADGLYVREISVPKGYLVISKIHKFSHASFLLKGDISIFGTDGVRRLKAPMSLITPAGTKRAIYHHEDTIFCTVHATNETDIEKIEKELTTMDFSEADDCIEMNIINNIQCHLQGGMQL